jgi:3-hydroxy acid dehydrogenase / malonic semialdehyde reductase
VGRSIPPSRTPFDLRGRLALVTGASAGIGAATAEELARQGADLVLVARREERLKGLADRLASEHGVTVDVAAMDIAERAALEAWARLHGDLLARVDVLVNNAGLARGVDLVQDADPADWETMVQTNVLALLYLTRLVLPHMLARGTGDIVNLGSTAGRWVYRGGAVYAATKHAVRAISEGIRMDVNGSGIRVVNIEPGLVETEFSLVRLGDPERAAAVYADTVPLVAADIAEIVRWCLTLPRHVNIQELVVFPTDQAAVGMVHRSKKEAKA